MRQHDKIINMAAKKVLAPKGLFRQGTSRTWLDDNGYLCLIPVIGPKVLIWELELTFFGRKAKA